VSDADRLAWASESGGVDVPSGKDGSPICTASTTDRRLWMALDDRLRLTVAQLRILETFGDQDDDLAEDLAAEEYANAPFDERVVVPRR
jgi:hypothetical protein